MSVAARILIACAFLAAAGCSQKTPPGPDAAAPSPAVTAGESAVVDVPAGEYKLDRSHASLTLRADHLGFSFYTARFKRFDAWLQFDPANLAASQVTVNIDPTSIETDYPDPATLDFNAQLQDDKWLHTAQFPQMTFRSTAVELTGPRAMSIKGDLTIRGITRPMTLQATFNGGYAGHEFDPFARIGFSARGSLKRSEFGMGYGVPEPGSEFGVGDEVEVIIETEFSGPPWVDAPAAKAPAANAPAVQAQAPHSQEQE